MLNQERGQVSAFPLLGIFP